MFDAGSSAHMAGHIVRGGSSRPIQLVQILSAQLCRLEALQILLLASNTAILPADTAICLSLREDIHG